MKNKYSSVKELIEAKSESNEFKKKATSYIQSESTAKTLIYLRLKNKLTQTALAKKIGCTQSKISKIEASPNELISVSDLSDYAKALNKRVVISFEDKNITIVNKIKLHVFQIKALLKQLTFLAKGDKEIEKGVSEFFGEALFNILNLFESSSKNLRSIKISKVLKKDLVFEKDKETEGLKIGKGDFQSKV